MGLLSLLFSEWRKKDTSKEILESLEKDIQVLESSQRRNEQLRKKFIGSLIIYSILLYIMAAVIYYFYYFPKYWKDRVVRSLPLLIFPFLVYLLKRVLHYVFVSRMAKNATKLEELKTKKKEVLEQVMENETYKTAKELLEKYDPNYIEASKQLVAHSPDNQAQHLQGSAGTELRQRSVGSPGTLYRPVSEPSLAEAPNHKAATSKPETAPNSPSHARASPNVQRKVLNTVVVPPGTPGSPIIRPPGPPKPQYPILPRERTKMDKFVEYIIGDGPSNRYALICKECFSHNGMALKEDFEYITFRCCYCFHVNPARKQRPTAPKLESFLSPVRKRPVTTPQGQSDKEQKNVESCEKSRDIGNKKESPQEIVQKDLEDVKSK